MKKTVAAVLTAGRYRTGTWGSDDDAGLNGVFHVDGPCGALLRIIVSDGTILTDKYPWEHVSVSTQRRLPNWQEMCFVKDLFWDEEEAVMQLHPPKSEYVNYAPHCLHLWRPLREKIPMPPTIMVGPKGDRHGS